MLRNLQEPAIKVADGVAEAASVHLRSLFTRLRVVNRELRDAERQLDELCAAIGETDAASGECLQRQDVMILRSMPGIGRINLATLLCEGSGPLSRRDYPALRTLCGAAPVTKRSGKSHIVVMRYAAHVRLRNMVYHWARVATQHDPKSRGAMPRYADAAIRTAAPYVASRTGCLAWLVSFYNDRRRLTRILVNALYNRHQHEPPIRHHRDVSLFGWSAVSPPRPED